MRTNPQNVSHFMATSNMSRGTLAMQAKGLALDHGIVLAGVTAMSLPQIGGPGLGVPTPRFYDGDPPATISSSRTPNVSRP